MQGVVLVNNAKSSATDTIEVFYTSPVGQRGTVISSFTATNSTGSNKSYKAYIYDSTGTATSPIIPTKGIINDGFDTGSAIVNHKIPAGGTLRMESSSANGINFYVTGNEL